MKRISEMGPPEYYWVPEDAMFDTGGDCLDKFPDLGPAALVANHVIFDETKKRLQIALSAFEWEEKRCGRLYGVLGEALELLRLPLGTVEKK